MELNKDYVEDLQGDKVQVGSTIVYGATDGRSGGIRVGTVIKIAPEHMKPRWKGDEVGGLTPTKLHVQVTMSSGYDKPSKPAIIDATLKRFVRL